MLYLCCLPNNMRGSGVSLFLSDRGGIRGIKNSVFLLLVTTTRTNEIWWVALGYIKKHKTANA